MAFLASLLAQPTVQAVGAGLLTGALGGGALLATGVIPINPEKPETAMIQLLECPGEGRALANVPEGAQLLLTGRSADGQWYEVYIGQPGVDRAWAAAGTLQVEAGAGDALPVADCAAPEPAPLPSPAPLETLPTEFPTPEPTLTPTDTPLPSPTPTPHTTATATVPATPSPTPKATRTPTPTKKPTPAPTKTPTPPPPTPTPTPAPTPDNAPPTQQNLRNSNTCIDLGAGSQSTIQVRAIDNVAVSTVKITVIPDHGTGLITNMTMTAGAPKDGIWSYTITGSAAYSRGWGEGYIHYQVKAIDTNGNESTILNDDLQSTNNFLYWARDSGCFIG